MAGTIGRPIQLCAAVLQLRGRTSIQCCVTASASPASFILGTIRQFFQVRKHTDLDRLRPRRVFHRLKLEGYIELLPLQGRLKMQDWKMKDKSGIVEWNMWTGKWRFWRTNEESWKLQDWNLEDNFARLENAGQKPRTQKWTTNKSISVALDYVLYLTEESTINNELKRIICGKSTINIS